MGFLRSDNDLLKIEKMRYKASQRALSAAKKELKSANKAKRKETFHKIVNKIAAKPISRRDGMEMMFGTRDFRKTMNRKYYE